MPLGIHALDVCIVVALLCIVGGAVRGAGAGQSADKEPNTRARRSARAAVNRCAGSSAERRADRSAAQGAFVRGLRRRHATHLLVRVLPAAALIEAELIEAFAGAGQRHYGGTGRVRGARGQADQGGEQQ